MPKTKEVGLTYNEYLRAVRARQFGTYQDDITPITEGTQDVKASQEEEVKKQESTKGTKKSVE